MRRCWLLILGALVLACVVSGCAPEPVPFTPVPTPEPTLSDDELLQEAREVYDGFDAAYDEMSNAETVDYTILSPWATDEVATMAAADETTMRRDSITDFGSTDVTAFLLMSREGDDQIDAAICLDVSAAGVLAADGSDITPADRPLLVPLHLVFERVAEDRLIISFYGALDPQAAQPCG